MGNENHGQCKRFSRKKSSCCPCSPPRWSCSALTTARRVFFRWGTRSPPLAGREAYLNSLGWEIDPETESFRTVIVPEQLEGIMAQYNKLQLKQGYDLSRHLGESCLQYCYEVTNYPDRRGQVLVSLYLQDGEIIAADIHSTALNGFMHGLTKARSGQ